MNTKGMRTALAVCLGLIVTGTMSCRVEKPAEPSAVPQVEAATVETRPFSHRISKRGRALEVRVHGAEHVLPKDHVDLLVTFTDPKTKMPVALTPLMNVIVLAVDDVTGVDEAVRDLTLMLLPEEVEVLSLAGKLGALHVSLRNPEDIGTESEQARTTIETVLTGERARALYRKRTAVFQQTKPVVMPAPVAEKNPELPPVDTRFSSQVRKRARALRLPVAGVRHVQKQDRVDLLLTMTDPRTQQLVTSTLIKNVIVLWVSPRGDSLTVQVLREEAELLVLAVRIGSLTASLRHPESPVDFKAIRARTTIETLITGERVKALAKKRDATIQIIRTGSGGGSIGGYSPPPAAGKTERYADYGVNEWTDVDSDRLSTFAADVDTGSYTIARRKLHEGVLPPPAAVRTEEFVNYFRYAYPAPEREPFGVALEASPSPFAPKRVLLRVGIQAQRVKVAKRKPVHLTFLVDSSGSMTSADKIALVKRSLRFLVDQLQDGDTVAMATYAGHTKVVLSPTGMAERAKIHNAIEDLTAAGSTAMASGLSLAYDLAWKNFRKGAVNRVIVCSDGDANVGATEHGDMLESIKYYAERGVTLSTVGFGMGNYKDDTMEQLANKGNGNYSYVDTYSQAKRLFGQDLLGTLQVIAQDVKLQVEFDPKAVARYRLIGYENRDIADHDFRNDDKDAGEIGSGHAVTALYELEMRDATRDWGTVRVRWKTPGGSSRAAEKAFAIKGSVLSRGFDRTSLDLQRAVLAAGLAEHLRESPSRKDWAMSVLRERARRLAKKSKGPSAADDDELLTLLEVSAQLLSKKAEAAASGGGK